MVQKYAQRDAKSPFAELSLVGDHGGLEGITRKLQTHVVNGLDGDEAGLKERQKEYGENRLPQKPPRGFLMFCLDAMKDQTMQILIVCAAVSIILGTTLGEEPSHDWIDGFAIFVAIAVTVLVTALNDYNKEKQFRLLNSMNDDKECCLVRGGADR